MRKHLKPEIVPQQEDPFSRPPVMMGNKNEISDCLNNQDVMLPAALVAHSVKMPMANGAAPDCSIFDGLIDGKADHFSLSFPGGGDLPPLVRVHDKCVTGDGFGSRRCDCGPQLDEAIARLTREGGYLLYLDHEGRGIGLAAKIAAYSLQDSGLDTFEANRRLGFPDDMRDHRPAAQMLHALGARRIRLLTNNPAKVTKLEQWGIEVVSVEPTVVSVNEHNKRYLAAKRDLKGHSLSLAADVEMSPRPEHAGRVGGGRR